MASPPATQQRPAIWRDVRVLRVAVQVAAAAIAIFVAWYLWGNLTANLRRLGIRTDFGYLSEPAGFAIADSQFRSSQTLRQALVVGIKNTAIVAVAGVILSTVLGIVVGIARLSTNFLVRMSAAVYVETLRNVPVVVVIVFLYLAVFLRLPSIGAPIEWLGLIVLSNRGVVVASATGDTQTTLTVLAAAAVAALAVGAWRTVRFRATGVPHHRELWALATFLAVAVVGWAVTDKPLLLDRPVVAPLSTTGGVRMSPEFAGLLSGLVLYTASHIAEIVRGSILAVDKGQTEAATALGLNTPQRMRLVILPQAFRVAIPPLANQYLNLTKNSSLAVFVGYVEVTRVTGITISQGNPAPQAILLLMGIYLVFSLIWSLLTNVANRRLRLGLR